MAVLKRTLLVENRERVVGHVVRKDDQALRILEAKRMVLLKLRPKTLGDVACAKPICDGGENVVRVRERLVGL